MEQLGTVANRASGLTLESAYLSSLFTQAVRGDHSLLPDGMRPVVLQTDSQHRSTAAEQAGTAAAPQAASAPTESTPPTAATATAALRAISINPGYAPMMVSQGSGVSNRFRMTPGVRSVSMAAGSPGQMEMIMTPGGDPAAAGEILEGMLASGIVPGAQVRDLCSCFTQVVLLESPNMHRVSGVFLL